MHIINVSFVTDLFQVMELLLISWWPNELIGNPECRIKVENHWSRLCGVWKKILDFKNVEHFKNCQISIFCISTFCGAVHVCAERDESRECNPQHQQCSSDAFSSSSLFHSTSNTDKLSLFLITSSFLSSPLTKKYCDGIRW